MPEEFAEPAVKEVDLQIDPALTPPKKESDAPTEEQPRQTKLTVKLIELTKKKPGNKNNLIDSDTRLAKVAKTPDHAFETDSLEDTPDVTVDLDQPRSRSGQHWKTEYEQYHRRSSREIKQIIKYGQNIKSYALKKDSEATSLAEKLEKELAKVARMEKRVTNLAAQLNASQSQGPEGETEQQRLVGELAQQTALAIRYKQKADQYKAAIQEQYQGEPRDSHQNAVQADGRENARSQRLQDQPDLTDVSSNTFYLQAQLDDLRKTSQAAEDHAKQLERENNALKRNLLRVKEEMTSYETRRHAREENLKKREEKHETLRKECEKRLAQLTFEHQELLRKENDSPKRDEVVEIQTNQSAHGRHSVRADRRPPETIVAENATAVAQASAVETRNSKPSISPRKRKPQNNAVDIWTLNSPNDAAIAQDAFPESTLLPPSSVRHDIHRTLKEIDQNLGTEKQAESKPTHAPINLKAESPLKALAIEARERMETRKTSPRPKMINFTSSPAKLQPSAPADVTYTKPSRATVGRSASLMSAKAGSRTSTLGSVRGSALPADRAAAAKARLAKRSAEKRRLVSA